MCVRCAAVAYAQGGPQMSTDRTSQRAKRCSWPQCRSDSVEVPCMAHQEGYQWGLGCREPSPGWRKSVAILRETAGSKPSRPSRGLSKAAGCGRQRRPGPSIPRPLQKAAPQFYTALSVLPKFCGPDIDLPREPLCSNASHP